MDQFKHCFTCRRKRPSELSLQQIRNRNEILRSCMDSLAFSWIDVNTRNPPGRESAAVKQPAKPSMAHPNLNGSRREPA